MVLGLCRRMLGHAHDAEDAFQATFLVLVRKAASLGQRQLVGNWLYGTAYRAALEARAARRRSRERQVSPLPEPESGEPAEDRSELRPLLDRELSRLPQKYREAVVLCDLEGRTRREAALQLGIPEGTLSSRLATARRMLARRLARHGLPAAALAALTPAVAQAAVGPSLVLSTTKAAALCAAGKAAAGVLPAPVAALTEGVIRAMFMSKLKTLAAVLVVLALAAGGTAIGLGGRPAGGLHAAPAAKAPKGPAKIAVRKLKVKRDSLPAAGTEKSVHGRSLVKVFRSQSALEKVAGKKAADELARQVNFAREDVVLVSWVGGPTTRLAFRVVGKGKGRTVEFYLTEPPDNGKPRPLLATLGADFFAVTRRTAVRLEKPAKGGRAGAGKRAGVPPSAPADSNPNEPEIAPPENRE
jgi:RNA polymerase sigma factor (sigma-70 family)